MNSLYQISEEYLSILKELEDNGGELTPEIEEKLAINHNELEKKTSGYTYIMKVLEGQVALATEEIDRIKNFREAKIKQYERLEAALLQAVLLYGKEDKLSDKDKEAGKIPVKRLEFGTLRLSTRRAEAVDILNETKIKDDYKYSSLTVSKLSKENLNKILEFVRTTTDTHENIVAETVISKTKIKEAIKAKKEVEGAILKDNYSLTIK